VRCISRRQWTRKWTPDFSSKMVAMAVSRVWESSLLKRGKLAGTGPAGLGAMSATFLPSSCGADGDGMTWQQHTTRPGPVGSMLQRFETPTASRGSSGQELLRRPLIQKSGPRANEFRSTSCLRLTRKAEAASKFCVRSLVAHGDVFQPKRRRYSCA